MNPAVVEAERRREVRDAARGWKTAGFLSEEQFARSTALYSDHYTRLGPGFAVLSFVFALVAVAAVMGFFMVLFEPRDETALGTFFLLGACGLAALTEAQRGKWRRVHCGSDDASALTAALFGVVGIICWSGVNFGSHFSSVFFGASSIGCAFAAWRWGDLLFSGIGSLALFGWLVQSAHGRALWILAAACLIPIALRASRSETLPPSHRKGMAVMGVIAIAALYAAIHIYSWDHGWIEVSPGGPPATGSLRLLSILGTALLPPALLVIGFHRREPLLIYSGLLLLALSVATIRLYYDLMPLWAALLLLGGACLGTALLLRRWLRSGALGERHGFTADPLFENRNRTAAVQAVVSMASFTPAAQPSAEPALFKGGGGAFGGGGASGAF